LKRKLFIGIVLGIPVIVLAMGSMWPGNPLAGRFSGQFSAWLQAILSTPVVFWCGWIFFRRAWDSILALRPNMFTLLALGIGTAYLYSLVVAIAPHWFTSDAVSHAGMPEPYFESAVAITLLALLGQVLELSARRKTGDAVSELLQLTPE